MARNVIQTRSNLNDPYQVACNPCPFCGMQSYVMVEREDHIAWKAGKYVQDAFPYLPVEVRELLISGTCSPCFDKAFPDDDDEHEFTAEEIERMFP